jgi:hypothetical protein
MVFSMDPYTVRIGDPENDRWQTIEDLKPIPMAGSNEENKIKVEF